MTPTEALDAVADQLDALKANNEFVTGTDIADALAALGYEVRPILPECPACDDSWTSHVVGMYPHITHEQAAEAADREAAGAMEPNPEQGQPSVTPSAAADPHSRRPHDCEALIEQAAEDGPQDAASGGVGSQPDSAAADPALLKAIRSAPLEPGVADPAALDVEALAAALTEVWFQYLKLGPQGTARALAAAYAAAAASRATT